MIIECLNCKQYVNAKEVGSYWRDFNGTEPSRKYSLLACPECQEPILVRQTNIGNMAEGDQWAAPLIVYPLGELSINQNVPPAIRAAFEEACACYRSNAYTASAIMCRKALEAICETYGVKEKNLSVSLKKMKEKTLIDERLFEWSDALRVVGNEAAHNIEIIISPPDAKDAIEFTSAILDYIFSYRDRFEKFKKRRFKATSPTR